MEGALLEAEPAVGVELAGLLEIVGLEVEDDELAAGFEDAASLVDGALRVFGVVEGLAEGGEVDGAFAERDGLDVAEDVAEVLPAVLPREPGAHRDHRFERRTSGSTTDTPQRGERAEGHARGDTGAGVDHHLPVRDVDAGCHDHGVTDAHVAEHDRQLVEDPGDDGDPAPLEIGLGPVADLAEERIAHHDESQDLEPGAGPTRGLPTVTAPARCQLGIGEHRREDSAGFIGNPTALQMRKALAESGPSIDFSKEIGDADRGKMGVKRRKGAIRFSRRDRLQRRNPQLAEAELYVFQRIRLRFSLDLCQSTGEPGTPFG